jgi:cell wall-associated NlpC family hydrolase
MKTSEPVSTTCDCSMYVRWALAQAGIATSTQWTANGLLPNDDTLAQTPQVSRGVGAEPPSGGYRPGDIIFFGHDDGPTGHDALWLGNGQIVQCSASGSGSNIRPLAGYVAPTGWVRWNLGAGG